MKYFFTSKIEKENDEVKINIPFNVWEVCKHRDEISAELIIDNQFINCNLVPLEKGLYVLTERFSKNSDPCGNRA